MTDGTGINAPLWNAAEPAGKADTERAVHLLSARLPAQLAVFARLAYDFAGFWHVEGRRLFARIHPHIRESSERNPVRFLAECPTAKLVQAAQDQELLARAQALWELLEENHAAPCQRRGRCLRPLPSRFSTPSLVSTSPSRFTRGPGNTGR